MKCLYVSLIPLSLLAFIFLVVALVSNHWVTITKCWTPGNTAATVSLEYSQGLFQKCTSGTCKNLMDGPAEKRTIPVSFCSARGNSWFVDPSGDCQMYYKCENGLAVEEGTCTGTQQFDLYTQKCISTQPSCGCHDIRCKGKAAGNKVVSGLLCSGWFQCKMDTAKNTKVYSSGTCASGEFFDESVGQQKCVTVKPASCKDKECVSGENALSSVVVTDKPVCENYYKCDAGIKKSAVKCNAGETALLSHAGIGANQCRTKTSTQPTADRATCQNPKCKADAKSKRVSASNCQYYYSCSSKLITYSTCTGTSTSGSPYFDEATEKCVAHANKPADCKAVECIGRGDGYRTIDTDCLAWTRCSNSGKTYTTSISSTQCVAGKTINVIGGGTPPCEATQQSYCKNPKCKGLANGYHLITTPDATACKKYFRCGAGEVLIQAEQSCSANAVFVGQGPTCQGTTASGSTTCWDPRCTSLDATHKKTLTDYSNTGQINGRVNCRNYWECKNGFRTDKDCGANSFYDKANTQCTSTRPTNCQDSRCVSKADRKYGTDGTDCLTYKECTNQLQTATGSCPVTGGVQTLFNSFTGVCDDPTVKGMPTGCKVKVNGGWSPWSLFGACSMNYTFNAKPQVGITSRQRRCTCPVKQGSGADCAGTNFEASFCHKCSPEKGWLMGARAGMALSMACSIMTLLWACWCCYSMKCYAVHAVIFHTFVSVIAGLVGAIMANGNRPDLGYTCEVASGWGFIMAILGVILTIITHIIAIVIAVKGRNRVQSADCSEMKEKKGKSKDKGKDNGKVRSTEDDETNTNSQQNLQNNRTSQQHESTNQNYEA